MWCGSTFQRWVLVEAKLFLYKPKLGFGIRRLSRHKLCSDLAFEQRPQIWWSILWRILRMYFSLLNMNILFSGRILRFLCWSVVCVGFLSLIRCTANYLKTENEEKWQILKVNKLSSLNFTGLFSKTTKHESHVVIYKYHAYYKSVKLFILSSFSQFYVMVIICALISVYVMSIKWNVHWFLCHGYQMCTHLCVTAIKYALISVSWISHVYLF